MALYRINGLVLHVPDAFLTPKLSSKLEQGQYERDEAKAVLLSVEPGDRVLDLGAGIGYIACLSAMSTGAENVLSIEANEALLPVVQTNFTNNDLGQARIKHGAVVGKNVTDGVISFQKSQAFWASSLYGERGQTVSVPALQLDDLLADHRPDVVMMDVEGGEQDMFDHVWPDFVRTCVLELHPEHYGDEVVKKIFDCMSASGLTYDVAISTGALVGFRRVGIY